MATACVRCTRWLRRTPAYLDWVVKPGRVYRVMYGTARFFLKDEAYCSRACAEMARVLAEEGLYLMEDCSTCADDNCNRTIKAGRAVYVTRREVQQYIKEPYCSERCCDEAALSGAECLSLMPEQCPASQAA